MMKTNHQQFCAALFIMVVLALPTTSNVFATESFSDNFNDGVLNPTWHVQQNGCNITETGGQLRIQGTTVQSGWGNGNGIYTDNDFPGGDFDVSVDFSVPQFSGSGTRLIYLQASCSSETVGIFYSVDNSYCVQAWNPPQFSGWLAPFGDENSAFHRMRLVYDFDQKILTGYVDNYFVGSLSTLMSGNVGFTIQAATETSGMVIDTRFDNFNVVLNEPTTLVLIGTGTSTWVYPLATYYHDARTQTIYLASEIGDSYNITALALYVTQVPGQTMNNFTIRMKHTDLSVYGGSPNWESSGWTTVYQTNKNITTTGWVQFDFTTPFEYNGTQNLMVDISFNNSSYTTDGQCRYSTPGGTRTIYYRTDSGYGDPLAWSGTTPTPNATNNVPNLKLIVESLTRVIRPVFTPDGGTYNSEQNVVITCATDGATIHYTTNGIDPTESDPTIISGSSILIDHSLTLKARAWKSGLDPSNIKSANYQLVVTTPVFAPDGGFYQSEQDVVITCMTSGATIHYTTNGIDPTESDPTIASGGSVLVSVDPSTTLKARAWKAGLEPSSIKEAIYLYNPINNYSMEGNFIYQDPLGYIAEYWTGWEEGYNGYFSEDTYYAHDGSKSHKISWSNYGYSEFGPDGIYQQISSLQPGQAYLVSVWFKYLFQSFGMMWGEGDITFSVGTDPNGGTDPDVVTNWTSVSDSAWGGYYEGPWLNVVTFFSATGSTTTLFIKASGSGNAEQEDPYCPEPPCPQMPAPWDAYCYIDDVVIHQIEIDPASSTVEATSPVPANGARYSEVTITVLDPYGNPIEGVPPSEIDVNCSGSGNIILGPDGPTNVNGQTTAKIASFVAEIKTVSATVLGTVLSDTATVHFCESRHMKFRASDGAVEDYFGYSVAIDGNTALVGAYGDDDKGDASGSAYIFRFNGSTWVEEAKLLASDGAAYDYFGYSVAIDGNTALVGAIYGGSDSGSAYIFRFNGSSWVEEAKLLAPDGAAYDYFGRSVAIDGNTALVGAYGDDDKGNDSGSAYVFPTTIPGDLDGDGLVNFFDYSILAEQWLDLPGQPSADVAPCGGDCEVNFQDLEVLCSYWLEGI
jgi:hypothetical protein